MITGTSTTIDELDHHGTCRCTQRACQRLCPELQRLQVWELGCLLHARTRELDRHNKDITTLSMYSGESLEDQGNLHLRHDRDVNDLVKKFDELQLRNLYSFLLVETQLHLSSQQRACPLCSRTAPQCTCRRNNGHVHFVQELHPNAPVVATTGMSTLVKNCNCGTPQFSERLNPSTVCTQRA